MRFEHRERYCVIVKWIGVMPDLYRNLSIRSGERSGVFFGYLGSLGKNLIPLGKRHFAKAYWCAKEGFLSTKNPSEYSDIGGEHDHRSAAALSYLIFHMVYDFIYKPVPFGPVIVVKVNAPYHPDALLFKFFSVEIHEREPF